MKNLFYTLWSICLIVLMLYVWKVFFIPFALSIFFWLVMSYQAKFLSRYMKGKRGVYIIIFVYIVLLGAGIYGIGASAGYIQDNISSLSMQVTEWYILYEEKIASNSFITSEDIANRKEKGKAYLDLDILWWIASWTLTSMTTWILIIVLSFLLLLAQDRIIYTVVALYGKQWEETIYIARKTVAQYCLWLSMLILILFILNSIWLLVLSVPYAILIAAISAFATLVPTIWTFIGGIFATLVGGFLTESMWIWLWIMAWYLCIQQIEEFVIMPRVVGKRVSINTLTSIISLFAWWLLWGVAWLFLAIPIMGVIQKLAEKNALPVAVLMGTGEVE